MSRQQQAGGGSGKRRGGGAPAVPPGWAGPRPQDIRGFAGHLGLWALLGTGPGGTPRLTLFDKRTGTELGHYHPATGHYRYGSRDGVESHWRTALRLARESRPRPAGRDRV